MQALLDFLSNRFFGIKLFDVDFWELLLRLGLNTLVTYLLILKVYVPSEKKSSNFLFTYLMFSPIVFFICHLFSSVNLEMGFAFGLFAIFSMLRYRTQTIPIKELTYLFIVIGLAVINALATKKVSYIELLFTNVFILSATCVIENYIKKKKIEEANDNL